MLAIQQPNLSGKDFKELLQNNVLKVRFTKQDGEERVMLCTLIESKVVPYEKKTDKVRPINEDIVACWDVEKNAWRSFNVKSVKSVEVV